MSRIARDEDRCFPPEMIGEMHAAIAGAHLRVIPHAGHWPVRSGLEDRFAETVLDFLTGDWDRQGTGNPGPRPFLRLAERPGRV